MTFKLFFTISIVILYSNFGHSQYDDWTFVRVLPNHNIENFEPISEEEIVVLSQGSIYHSDDLGDSWKFITEIETNLWTSLQFDNNGYYYYKNDSGLYRSKLGGTPEILLSGQPRFRLSTVKEDTIVMASFDQIHYSIDGGTTWQISSYHSNTSSVNNKYEIIGDDVIFLYYTMQRFNLSDMTYNLVHGWQRSSEEELDFVVLNDNDIFIESVKNEFQIHFLSQDGGNSFSKLENINLPPSYPPNLHKGSASSIVSLNVNRNQNELSLYHSSDLGKTWSYETVASNNNEKPTHFIQNPKSPYAFIITETGKLYRTTNAYSSITPINQQPLSINVIPNPTSSMIKIEGLGEANNLSLNIFSTNGQLIKEWQGRYNREIDVSQLATGHYYLDILDNETGKTYISNFIKE